MAGARIDATMLLCDHAESVAGKLYVLGGGWTQLQTRTPLAMGLAVKLSLPEEFAGRRLPLLVTLVTAEGSAVADKEKPITFTAEMEFARRPGQDVDAPLGAVFAVNAHFQGLELEPGRYAWELWIANDLAAKEPFSVA